MSTSAVQNASEHSTARANTSVEEERKKIASEVMARAERQVEEQRWVDAEVDRRVQLLAEEEFERRRRWPDFVAELEAREAALKEKLEEQLKLDVAAAREEYLSRQAEEEERENQRLEALNKRELDRQREEQNRLARQLQEQEREVDALLEKGRREAQLRKEEKARKKAMREMKKNASFASATSTDKMLKQHHNNQLYITAGATTMSSTSSSATATAQHGHNRTASSKSSDDVILIDDDPKNGSPMPVGSPRMNVFHSSFQHLSDQAKRSQHPR
ncbi:unnamed protein product [Amoebophrya sp. A25]|nr:unnamed protein product [Amoebophrya sp. A25]|eukprot:GSA25T00019696001.1